VYAILPHALVRSESSLAAAPQRQHKMQRSAAFETIFRRGFVVGPASLRQRRSWLDLLGVGGERNETKRTFACRRRSTAAGRAGCLLFLRRAPLSWRPGGGGLAIVCAFSRAVRNEAVW
jgi:hypothetical protein